MVRLWFTCDKLSPSSVLDGLLDTWQAVKIHKVQAVSFSHCHFPVSAKWPCMICVLFSNTSNLRIWTLGVFKVAAGEKKKKPIYFLQNPKNSFFSHVTFEATEILQVWYRSCNIYHTDSNWVFGSTVQLAVIFITPMRRHTSHVCSSLGAVPVTLMSRGGHFLVLWGVVQMYKERADDGAHRSVLSGESS